MRVLDTFGNRGVETDWSTSACGLEVREDVIWRMSDAVTVLRFADWENGMAPFVENGLVDWNGLEPEGFEIR